jgi:hypothetical protein
MLPKHSGGCGGRPNPRLCHLFVATHGRRTESLGAVDADDDADRAISFHSGGGFLDLVQRTRTLMPIAFHSGRGFLDLA